MKRFVLFLITALVVVAALLPLASSAADVGVSSGWLSHYPVYSVTLLIDGEYISVHPSMIAHPIIGRSQTVTTDGYYTVSVAYFTVGADDSSRGRFEISISLDPNVAAAYRVDYGVLLNGSVRGTDPWQFTFPSEASVRGFINHYECSVPTENDLYMRYKGTYQTSLNAKSSTVDGILLTSSVYNKVGQMNQPRNQSFNVMALIDGTAVLDQTHTSLKINIPIEKYSGGVFAPVHYFGGVQINARGYVTGEPITSDFTGFIDDGLGSFFTTPLFGSASLGTLLITVLAVVFVVIFLKIFAGG